MTPEADPRDRILDAAEDAFAEHGLAGARVAAIARQAGVNKAMLYYYFGSKDELYDAVLERIISQIVDMAARVGAAPHLRDEGVDIVAFLDGYRGVLHQHPAFVRLMLRTLLDGGDRIERLVRPRIALVMPVLAGLIALGQAEGRLNPAPLPSIVPPVMVSQIFFFALMRPHLASLTGVDESALVDAWRQTSTELLMNGLLARPQEAP